jgi:nucleotide-binding universal stress UspA family protein
MRHGLDTLIEDQPLVAGAIAMALGAAVGGALPRSRMEDQGFGEQSDRAMEAARTLASEQGAKVQATASAVVDEALNIAGEASAELGAKLPSGEDIVDAAETKVREAATRLREAGAAETAPEQSDRPTG